MNMSAPKRDASRLEWLHYHAHKLVNGAEVVKDRRGKVIRFDVRPLDFIALMNDVVKLENETLTAPARCGDTN